MIATCPNPTTDDVIIAFPERVAHFAGVLSAAVMRGEISLAEPGTAAVLLRRRGLIGFEAGDIADALDAVRVAIRMAEDRARRATAFRDPR